MNKETTENYNVNSLNKKTKVQLIDIILRKDAVERNLRKDIKGTENELNKIREIETNLRVELKNCNNDYEQLKVLKDSVKLNLKEEIAFYMQELHFLKGKIKNYKASFYFSFIINIVLVSVLAFLI